LLSHGVEHRHGFVEDSDPAILSHSSTIASYMVRIYRFNARDVDWRRDECDTVRGDPGPDPGGEGVGRPRGGQGRG
jgi:hypothetical protein